ncbi:MAG: GAF domain-containing protein [Oscillatoria sp. SIO1A7]|nr:GAF domain-containing protein [Oscillatoria sp. SIO1A7]
MVSRIEGSDGSEALSKEGLLYRMTTRIRQSLELEEILSAAAREVRSLLQIDRVKIYRFAEDSTGQVVAESIYKERLPALMGLYFPAGDVPPHAREMIMKARTRSIVDVARQRIILNRSEDIKTTGTLTVEEVREEPIAEILERAVDPCHVEYLTNMGVRSSLVVPIMNGSKLWGLLASHHAQSKVFSEESLRIVQLVADQISVAIAQSTLLSQARTQASKEALINQISTVLHAPASVQDTLEAVLEKIVKAVDASGGRLYLTSSDPSTPFELYTYGRQPQLFIYGNQPQPLDESQPVFLEEHPFWTELMELPKMRGAGRQQESKDTSEFSDLFATIKVVADLHGEPQLASLAKALQANEIRSLLILSLRYSQQVLGCLTLFRDEIDTDILWAGRFDPDLRQDQVRESFKAWRQLKKGQARPWTGEEIEITRTICTHLAMAAMQNRLYQWEREHRLLVQMRNRELDAARQQAEQASRLKSHLLSSTSHELRTPLGSTLNYLKLLQEKLYDNEEELREFISFAYKSAENLVAIINDVLDIAKIEAGRMSVQMVSIDLRSLVEEVSHLFAIDSRRRGISLIVEVEVDRIYADEGKLRQILTNLLSNAFKFTESGEIRLRAIQATKTADDTTKNITLDATDNAKCNPSDSSPTGIEISVIDTGIGIDPSKNEQLFEPFVQEDGSIKRRYGGTGLGLTISKRLVELMGGRIVLESSGKGRGTTVKISF